VLLGVIAVGEGVAYRILVGVGVDLGDLVQDLRNLISARDA
jgi:hypothetical protein